MHRPVNGAGYAVVTDIRAEPLSLGDFVVLQASIRATEDVIGQTCKGGRIYNRHPRLVADVNRTGKRFLQALQAVLTAAKTAQTKNPDER